MADAMIGTSAVSRHARPVHFASGTSASDSSDDQRLRGSHGDPRWRKGTDNFLKNAPSTSQRSACRLAKLHICASRAGYGEPHMSVGSSPLPPPQACQAQPGTVWTALILICATLTALAGAFTAFIMYMRPVLKRMEQAALATEVASKAMEQSAKEFEQTSLIFQADTPTMIAEIEAAAHEYRELGHTLNVMTAGFRGKNPVKDWSQLSMKRVAKDVSALTHALSPAMEQWRKRISKIAASFEANKAEISTAEKQTKSTNKFLKPEEASGQPIQSKSADSSKDTKRSEQAPAGTLQGVEATGQRLANAAISMRPAGSDSKARAKLPRSADAKGFTAALNLSDPKSAQAGADEINQAADAAEKVTSDVNHLVAHLAQGSQDGDAVEDAYEQSAASQDLPGMTEEEQALLAQLRDQKQTAEFVYKALERAEHAATAAATASGALQQAMLEAESQGELSSSDDTSGAASSSGGNGQDSKTRNGQNNKTRLKAQSKSRQEPSSQEAQSMADGISAAEMDSSADGSETGTHQNQNSNAAEVVS